jgi:hypothetical protein
MATVRVFSAVDFALFDVVPHIAAQPGPKADSPLSREPACLTSFPVYESVDWRS